MRHYKFLWRTHLYASCGAPKWVRHYKVLWRTLFMHPVAHPLRRSTMRHRKHSRQILSWPTYKFCGAPRYQRHKCSIVLWCTCLDASQGSLLVKWGSGARHISVAHPKICATEVSPDCGGGGTHHIFVAHVHGHAPQIFVAHRTRCATEMFLLAHGLFGAPQKVDT